MKAAHQTPTATFPIGTEPKSPFSKVDRLIRRPDVCEITSIPSSSLTDLIKKGAFPAPLKLSERMAAWRLSEVMAWMDALPRSTDGDSA